MTSPCHTQAVLIGQKAAERLNLPGYRGKVLAVVSSAVYLAGYDGEVLWLGQADLPAHRRCILASFHAENVEAGMGFAANGQCLCIGSEMTINLENADRWMPRAIKTLNQSGPSLNPSPPAERDLKNHGSLPPHAGEGQGIGACLEKILTAIRQFPAKGLGHALVWITQPAGRIDYSTVSAMDALLLRRAEPVIRELVTACRRRDMGRIVNVGLNLVGLGPGLTPSGDDYLGGLLFSAHHRRAAAFERDGDLLHDFLYEARSLTNRISHTILSDLAHGHGPAPLHDLIRQLWQGSAEQPIRDSAQRLIGMGHTSGWDMLAGALTGMLLRENFES